MQIGIIGLGRMGANITRRLMRDGHQCVVFDVAKESVQALVKEGAVGSSDLKGLVDHLTRPCAIWVMLPAGEITESSIMPLSFYCSPPNLRFSTWPPNSCRIADRSFSPNV